MDKSKTDACQEGRHEMCTTYVPLMFGGKCSCGCHFMQSAKPPASVMQSEQPVIRVKMPRSEDASQ